MADKFVDVSATYNGDGTASNQAPGSTVTITIASPGVVSWTAHGRVANDPVYFSTTGALPTGLTAGTKYFVRNPTADTFEVSATSGGASINTSGSQSGTHTCTGVGAWNSLIAVMNNTQANGAVANGDNVYVRTKNGTNLGQTMTTGAITTAVRLYNAQVNWIFDDGVKWSGDSGAFTLSLGTTSVGRLLSVNDFNNLIAKNYNFIVHSNYTAASVTTFFSVGQALIHEVKFSDSAPYGSGNMMSNQGQKSPVFERCWLKVGGLYGQSYAMYTAGDYSSPLFLDPLIDISGPNQLNTHIIFALGMYGAKMDIIGGRLIPASENNRLFNPGASAGSVLRTVGFDPGSINLTPSNWPTATSAYAQDWPNWLDMSSVDDKYGMTTIGHAGRVDWRANQNYPYGNAVLPDAANTPWSYKVISYGLTARPHRLFSLSERFTGTAAAKTITLNLLLNNQLTSPQKDEWFANISYVRDSDGVRVAESTKATGALATTTGVWNTLGYGTENYNERKIEITTAAAIRTNTEIIVTLMCTRLAPSATAFYFVDPEIVIS